MIRYTFCAIICVLSLSCASLNKSTMTKFEPFTENGKKMFRFSSEKNDSVYPDDSDGEAVRLAWLSEFLVDNNYCNNGYLLISRNKVKGGDIYGLRRSYFYIGECK